MPQNNDLPVLSILTFPHNWNQGKLEFSVLLLPRGNPLQHLGQTTAPFAGTRVELTAAVIQGLAGLPVPDNPDTVRFALRAKLPSNPRKFFDKLTGMATIVQRTPRPTAGLSIKKNLPGSYTKAFPFERARTNTEDGGEYACRLRTARKPAPANLNPPKELSWGEMLSYVLRQPELARNLGLVYDLELAPTGAHALSLLLASGGWLYVDLDRRDDSHPWSRLGAGQVRCYAARVPALSDARPLFAPVLFPVVSTAGNSALFDEVFDEAINYNDGFGRIVHCAQPLSLNAATGAGEVPAATEAGIQIGWDDEQVVTWYNRQLAIQAHKADAPEAPLGVAGYRVDVRPEGGAWRSLTAVTPHATLGDLGVHKPYEMWIQPAPVRLEAESSEYWFPRYFAQWRGGSLVARDEIAAKMSRHPGDPAVTAPNIRPAFPTLPLRYGQKYTFRVRLADLTGGGPALQDAPHNPATAHEVACTFLRSVPPKALRVTTDPPAPAAGSAPAVRELTRIVVRRPWLGYPEFTFAGIDASDALLERLPGAKAARRVWGVADPDVDRVRIVVEVRTLAGDAMGGWQQVYSVERTFPPLPPDPLKPDPALTLVLDYRPTPQIAELDKPSAANAPLQIPTARDVRIRLLPLCREAAGYCANDGVRTGLAVDLSTRKEGPESGLWVENMPADRLKVIRVQPGSGGLERIAQELKLPVLGLTISGPPGRRTIFGASGALRHQLAGDSSSITFATEGELYQHWIACFKLALNRDWTWDGLSGRGIEVSRDGQVVGQVRIPRALSEAARQGTDPSARACTDIIFFDAIDPNAVVGEHPREIEAHWTVRAHLKEGSKVLGLNAELPVSVPPAQVPKIVSAGIALTPYAWSGDYSSTEPRRRVLWVEFEEAIDDQANDDYFCRVLAYGPDPMLAVLLAAPLLPGGSMLPTLPDAPPRPLPIDPELVRVITPGMSDDYAGQDAMQPMVRASNSDRHYLVPLPPGLSEDSLELFGFFTYEFRVGHVAGTDKIWSTAQRERTSRGSTGSGGAHVETPGNPGAAPGAEVQLQQAAARNAPGSIRSLRCGSCCENKEFCAHGFNSCSPEIAEFSMVNSKRALSD